MILLIEGCDRTGKTTLARQLMEETGFPILHFKIPPSDPVHLSEFFLEPVTEALKEHEHFIIDRYHLSNHAYGGLLGGAVLGLRDYLWLDRYLASMDTWLFLMVDQPKMIFDRLQEEGDRRLTMADVGAIQNRFNDLYAKTEITPKGSFKLEQLIDEVGPTMQFRQIAEAIHGQLGKKCLSPLT